MTKNKIHNVFKAQSKDVDDVTKGIAEIGNYIFEHLPKKDGIPFWTLKEYQSDGGQLESEEMIPFKMEDRLDIIVIPHRVTNSQSLIDRVDKKEINQDINKPWYLGFNQFSKAYRSKTDGDEMLRWLLEAISQGVYNQKVIADNGEGGREILRNKKNKIRKELNLSNSIFKEEKFVNATFDKFKNTLKMIAKKYPPVEDSTSDGDKDKSVKISLYCHEPKCNLEDGKLSIKSKVLEGNTPKEHKELWVEANLKHDETKFKCFYHPSLKLHADRATDSDKVQL